MLFHPRNPSGEPADARWVARGTVRVESNGAAQGGPPREHEEQHLEKIILGQRPPIASPGSVDVGAGSGGVLVNSAHQAAAAVVPGSVHDRMGRRALELIAQQPQLLLLPAVTTRIEARVRARPAPLPLPIEPRQLARHGARRARGRVETKDDATLVSVDERHLIDHPASSHTT